MNFNLLDYKNCIANLPNSILKKFGVETVGDSLFIADKYLEKNYKNIVVLLLDGMGTHILEKNLDKDGFFRSHLVESYKSVYPPTTVAATTSINSGRLPIEHAWLGWDCYYPQVDKNVTVFLNTEQGTNNPVSESSVANKYCGYESICNKLLDSGHKAYYATPFEAPYPSNIDEICNRVVSLCEEEGDKYIYAYWNEPDTTMHKYGCYCSETKDMLAALEKRVQKMSEQLEDTLLIVTADHGHVDGRNVCIKDYPEILECLERLPSIEPRTLNLFVREGKDMQFKNAFVDAFGDDFILLTKSEVYESGLFGAASMHPNVDGMIGDYVAIAISDLTIFNTREEAEGFKGVHAGYTKEEMDIPFIVVESENILLGGYEYGRTVFDFNG